MAPPRKKRVVTADKLNWKAVPLPERLDDAEGFYGLEEIDDVEIVRDEKTRRVHFKAAAPESETSENESEWNGFGDDPPSEENAATVSGNNVDMQKKRKVDGKPVESTPLLPKSGNAFDKLGGYTEDEDEDGSDVSAWQQLGLSADSLTSLSRMAFSKPTPIQLSALPEILQGHDVIGKASTGSGKTLAYGLPIIEHFLARTPSANAKHPVALILAPTRELAVQITKHLTEVCSKLPCQGPRFATITGGLSIYKQQRLLKDANIIIATPGRFWEVLNSEEGLLASLRQIQFLVIDEADRLLGEGHFKEVEEILNSLDRADVDEGDAETQSSQKPQRQTLVFSATFQKSLQRKLAGKGNRSDIDMMSKQESLQYLLEKLNFRENPPKLIDVNPVSSMAANLREGLVECAANEKDLYLYALMLHHPNTRILIFANSISAVRRIAPFLQNLGLQAQALHSQMPQKARLRAVERFSSQKSSIMVATDVAARGLDIPHVKLVVHYNVPRQADVYVHRSGRTARAENAGSSILLCSPDEIVPVRRLIVKVHAQSTRYGDTSKGIKRFLRNLDLDRQVVNRLKERVDLSKRIADSAIAKEKHRSEDNWLKQAAEDLGVEYDSEEFAKAEGAGKKGAKGKKRRQQEAEARSLTKGELNKLKAELKTLLTQRVNVGVSERYLTAGGIDVDELLKKGQSGHWLGQVDGLDFD